MLCANLSLMSVRFSVLKCLPGGGLSVQTRPGIQGHKSGYSNRTVYLDVDVTPKIEVVVSDLAPGGAWSLNVRTPTTVQSSVNYAAVNHLLESIGTQCSMAEVCHLIPNLPIFKVSFSFIVSDASFPSSV